MKLKFTFIAILAMLSSFAVNAANSQQVDVVLPTGVSESTFGANTVTDGTNYYATLQAATEAVVGNADAVLYCKPSADVGSLQHAPVTATLTVYGNGASVTGGSERDFDFGNTDPSGGKDITADMTLTVKNLNGCGAWGTKATEHTVNLVFEGCGNMGKVLAYGTTGTLNITMTDCAFEGVLKEAIYSNADGAITLNNVAFSNLNKAINLNHKAAGTQTVTINGCSFTNCGNDVAADQIPVRVLTSVEGGKSVLNVSNTTFTGTPEGGADILLDYGVGVTEATVTGTAANVLPENKDNNAVMVNVTANQGYTNVAPTDVKVATLAELQAALAAENELPIIITAQIEIPADETVTIDLNGKTVNSVFNGNSTTNHIYALSNKGTLTIQDTKGNGSINSRGIYNYGSLTLNAGAINAIDGNGGYAVNNQNGSTFVMNGGVVAATNEDDHQSSSGGYDATALKVPAGCTATLNGGTINNVCDFTYAIEAKGTLNIPETSAITVNGNHGAIAVSGGETTINAGTFQIPADEYNRTDNVLYVSGGSLVVNGGTFIGDSDTAAGGSCLCDEAGKAVVNGGTFKGSSGGDVWGTTGTTIKGGTFENLTEKQHIADGYELGEDGKVTSSIAYVAMIGEQGYATLAEAVAAAQNNETITLVSNIELAEMVTIPAGKTLTIDLNGKAISMEESIIATAYAINNLGTLTIQDTKGNGSINARGIYNGYGNGGANVATAKITVVNGTINAKGTNGGGAAIFNYGVADIQGGTFTSVASYAIALQTGSTMTIGENAIITGGINSWQSTLTITGGTISNDKSGKHVVYAGESTVAINGGTFHNNNSGNATILASGSAAAVEITGGTFTLNIVDASSSYLIDATSSATYTISGGSFTGGIRAQGGTKYEITGGTFTNEYGNYNVYEGGDINISGGTFTGSYAQKFATDNLAAGYELDENGKVTSSIAYVAKIGEQGYETLSAAFAAVTDDAQTVVVLQDVTEELTGAYLRGNITTENGAKVTVNLTNSDWVYCPYTFVIGENVTLNVPSLFYYAGGSVINGTVVAGEYYQRYAGTKLTINEPGSMTVTSETCIIRYTDGDANAGIYINGDNNNETVGLNIVAAYFYQGMINANNANIKAAVYWQTNETDNQGSANLVLDNSTLNVTGSELDAKATGNSTVTLTNGSSVVIAGGFVAGEKTELSIDATSYIQYKGGKIEGETVLSGEGTEANPYLISSVDDLVLFRNSVNAGETKYNAEGVYVALGANIDLAGIDWSVNIGDDCAVTFDGIFDGKGFTISNLTATETATKADGYICTGLFGAIYDKAVVKNFTLENVTINAPYVGNNVSAVVGFAYACKGSIENVKVVGVNINAPKATGVGAIVGYDFYSPALKVENCIVDGANITAAAYAGGLVGYASSKIAMNNNTVEDVTVSATASVGAVAGIMLGGGSATDNTVKNVTLTANGERWANSSAVVAGTITGGAVTVSNTTVENVIANGAAARLVGGILVEKPTTDIVKVQAQIGDKFYTTLQAAATAAKENETVTLIADVEATEALNVNCALDLNGHSLMATVEPTALPEGYAALPNLDGKFVIGAQPTATVNNLGMTTVAAGDYSIWDGSFDSNTEDDGDMPLSFVMQFLADQDAEDMATSPFADWYGDFVLTFTGLENGSFTADNCYLAGHYGSFGWVKIPVDGMVIEDGARYPVMLGVGMGQKYDYICSSVEDFKCALYLAPEILEANPNIQVKLELGVVDNSKGSDAAASALMNNDNVYSVTEYTYDALDFDPSYITEFVIDDANSVDYTFTEEKTVGTLTYKRTLAEGVWNPLYLPFQISVEELVENYDIAYYNQMISIDTNNDGAFDDYEMEVAYITTGTLRANYPYFIRPKSAEDCALEYVAENVTLYPAVEKKIVTSSVANIFTLSGTHKAMSAEDLNGCYAISLDGWAPSEAGIKAHRLYLKIEENDNSPFATTAAKSIRIVVRGEGDGTTGIDEVNGENGEVKAIFDLTGRRVQETVKGGIYIINGKKVLVK